jgi:hypothetical protein
MGGGVTGGWLLEAGGYVANWEQGAGSRKKHNILDFGLL